MKIRKDFVTNSSSSSYIICFARVKEEEKANKIIIENNIKVFNADEVKEKTDYFGELGADWCGATIYGVDKLVKKYPDGKFIIIEDSIDADYDEYGEPSYNYDFSKNDVISKITEENGFTDIGVAEGEGRDG